MLRTVKYRIYPNSRQVEHLNRTRSLCKDLYNSALDQRKNAWDLAKESVTYCKQAKELPEIKRRFPEYKKVHSQVLQNVLKRIGLAFKAYFERVKKGEEPGYPRFRSYHRYRSVTYPQSGFSIKDGKLHVSKIGAIKVKQHRPIFQGMVKTLTIKRLPDGSWYAFIAVELPDIPEPGYAPTAPIGIDAGLTHMLTLSNGERIENPRWFRRTARKLKRAQQALNRKEKRSRNREKQRKKVAKIHGKIANQRNDHHHKVSRRLVDRYDCIVVENLNIRNMVRDNHYSKSIHDAGWGGLFDKIAYKAEDAGKWFLKVPSYYTTDDCHNCDARVPKTLEDRVHACPMCGIVMDRDHNSANKILRDGLETISGKLGVPLEWWDFKPVETGASGMISTDRYHVKSLSEKQEEASSFRAR